MKELFISILIGIQGLLGFGGEPVEAPVENFGATVLTAPQGGTGIGSATAGQVGDCVVVLDDSPFTYELGTCGSGGGGGGTSPFSTSTSLVSGQEEIHPIEDTSLFMVGDQASSTAELYYDPNVFHFFVKSASSTIAGPLDVVGNFRLPALSQGFGYLGSGGLFKTISTSTLAGQVFPFTSVTNYNSTSTALGLLNGFFSTASSTISSSFFLPSLSQGLLYTGTNGLVNSAASSSLFGYTPLNPTRQLTIAGTANQVTSSAGAQDLSADRTWTLSIPSQFNIQQASTTLLSAHQAWFGMTASTSIETTGKINFPYSSSTIYSSFITASSTNLRIGVADGCLNITGGLVGSTGSACGAGGGGSDPFTHPAAGQSATTSLMLLFANASTTQFTSTSSTYLATEAGNVGISTTTPQYPLDVDGQARITGSSGMVGNIGDVSYSLSLQNNANDNWLEMLNNGGPNKGVFFGITGNDFEQWNSQAGNLSFFTGPQGGATNRLTIKTDGKIGISTTTPGLAALTIASTTAPQLSLSAGAGIPQWAFRNAGGNFYLATSSVNGLSTSTVPSITIDSTNTVTFGNPLATCIALTGSIDLCDGTDASSAGGSGGGSWATTTSGVAGQNFNYSLENDDIVIIGSNASSSAEFIFDPNLPLADINATTTINALQVGTTAIGSNVAKFSPLTGLTTSNSESVGGVINENYGTTDALNHVIYSNNTGTQRVLSIISDAATYGGNTVHIRNDGTESALNILGNPAGKGIVKIGSQGAGDADAALLSMDASLSSFLGQTMFMKCGTNATCWNMRDANNVQQVTVSSIGNFGWGTTTPPWQVQIATSSQPQFVLTDPNAGTNLKHWSMRSVGGNFYIATSTDSYATSTQNALSITNTGRISIGTTTAGCLNVSATGLLSSLTCASGGGGSDPFSHFNGVNSATTTSMAIGTTTASNYQLIVSSSTAPQIALSDGAGRSQWTMRNAGGNFYLATTTVAGTATSTTAMFGISSNSGVHFGNVASNDPTANCMVVGNCIEMVGNNNVNTGVFITVENVSNGASAWSGFTLLNDLIGTNTTNYAGMFINSSKYNDPTFGTLNNVPNFLQLGNSMGATSIQSFASTTAASYINFSVASTTPGAGPALADERMRITGSGNIGLATTTPSPLSVQTNSSSTAPQLLLTSGLNEAGWAQRSAGGNLYFATTSPTTFATSTTAIAFQSAVTGSSGLLIGTSTLGSTGFAIVGTGYLWGLTSNTGASTYSLCLSSTNQVTTNTEAETCIASSRRFKENIQPLYLGLNEVLKLRTYSFDYKDGSGEGYGFMAEDVAEIDPLLASYDEDGLASGIKWSHITALNTKAIQELYALSGKAKQTVQDNWQWLCIGLLGLAIIAQQIQIKKLQK